ncbi:MAG: 1,4-alpha-glucan branching protein GlgB [Clostridium sp.]|nr:1,4-alpha-glucan branching protein GlgB [Clostridium sp.]MCM1547416.1 1,4-alpha-glucan branching protein GlgB [Ruminococcus sp.]
MDMHEFCCGHIFDSYNFLGVHRENDCFVFRTYAPNAKRITVIGSFNGWNEEDMRRDGSVWTYSNSNASVGDIYKYVVYTDSGQHTEHCDPYGFGMELRPAFASCIRDIEEYRFTDSEWMSKRSKNYDNPMNIYEVHLGSWITNPDDPNGWYNYSEIADKLIDYARENHFTHLEFMPLSEHPADCSWGYQSTGFFSPTSRYGTASQLMELVNKCHNAGIGVIMDFVPVHFAIDGYALKEYDGSNLYEYPPSDVGVSEWGTCNFNFSKGETRSFIQSAANYWLDKYHFDGLRMDAISRAIYWAGDPARGINGNTVEFIKMMNLGLHQRHPTAMLIAEDSTAYPKVTAPVEYDGLGFDYKWDLGWMNDTLDFFRTAPWERSHHYHKLTFSMAYFYSELFLLPFSHDENVHGKATIIQKMYGDYDEKFIQARALYMYMYTHPGKKLNFMGNELAQFREWDETRCQDWDMLHYPIHDAFHKYIKTLGNIYITRRSLNSGEYDMRNFKWIIADAEQQCVYIYERVSGNDKMLCAFNFSGMEQTVNFNAESESVYDLILHSRWDEFGGDVKKEELCIRSERLDNMNVVTMKIPPLSGMLFNVG